MSETDWSTKIQLVTTKTIYCRCCLICDAIIEESDHPLLNIPIVCDECKKAVEYMKKQMRSKQCTD